MYQKKDRYLKAEISETEQGLPPAEEFEEFESSESLDVDGGSSSNHSSNGWSSSVVGQHTKFKESSLSRVKGLLPFPLLAKITCNTPGSSSGYISEDEEEQDKCAHKVASDLRQTLLKEGVTTGVTEEEVQEIMQQALKLYSEDCIGLVDYALESSAKCLHWQQLGIPGPPTFFRFRLSADIHLTAITLEHVPKALSSISNITNTSKEFVILGKDTAPYQLVELRVLSYWGHPE
uniref:SUN domain-containing protein 2-like n=1 Tax=Phascolarctos cinereus TaxID=38626 RepID=A0A6P5JRA1_PHACI|nr:SUN domain-containing protein 2-like [Phascolarctos cinereus]